MDNVLLCGKLAHYSSAFYNYVFPELCRNQFFKCKHVKVHWCAIVLCSCNMKKSFVPHAGCIHVAMVFCFESLNAADGFFFVRKRNQQMVLNM